MDPRDALLYLNRISGLLDLFLGDVLKFPDTACDYRLNKTVEKLGTMIQLYILIIRFVLNDFTKP